MRTAMRSIRISNRGAWLRKLTYALNEVTCFKRSDLLLRVLRSDLRSVRALRSVRVFKRSDFLRSERLPPACPEHGHVISILE